MFFEIKTDVDEEFVAIFTLDFIEEVCAKARNQRGHRLHKKKYFEMEASYNAYLAIDLNVLITADRMYMQCTENMHARHENVVRRKS